MNILWVDDEPANFERPCNILRDAGFTIDFASTVAVAIRKLQAKHYLLAILDIALPTGELDSGLVPLLRTESGYQGIALIKVLTDGVEHIQKFKIIKPRLIAVCSNYTEEQVLPSRLAPRPDLEFVSKARVFEQPDVFLRMVNQLQESASGLPNQNSIVPAHSSKPINIASKIEGLASNKIEELASNDYSVILEPQWRKLAARVFHDHANSLTAISLALTNATRLFENRELKSLLLAEAAEFLKPPSQKLSIAIGTLIKYLEDGSKRDDLDPTNLDEAQRLHVALEKALGTGLALQTDRLADVIGKTKILIAKQSGQISKNLLRSVTAAAEDLEDSLLCYQLHQARLRLGDLNTDVQLMRDYFGRVRTEPRKLQQFDLKEAVFQAKEQLANYALQRRIEIRLTKAEAGGKSQQVGIASGLLVGNVQEITRAFRNIIHNSIKYSFSLKEESPWVVVKTVNDGHFYSLEVENWGVLILEDEIASGKIYEEGYRGVHSGDRQRLGNGIGLADTKLTVESYEGLITVSSALVNATNPSGPALTRVRVQLPVVAGVVKSRKA